MMTDERGSFELPGVPVFARWARAVCQNSGIALPGRCGSGDQRGDYHSHFHHCGGQGAGVDPGLFLSRDNRLIVGNRYQWALDKKGKQQYRIEGSLQDLETHSVDRPGNPYRYDLIGLDWSPVADEAVGALTGAKATWIWRWDAQGRSLGALIEMVNPEPDAK